MPQNIDSELKQALLTAEFRPAVTLWNRLEGRPRHVDFERSLRAEIRDPLWMLTRQWQFGEFRGEDAGSSVQARVQVAHSHVDRVAVKAKSRNSIEGEAWGFAVPYDSGLPLEVVVEREPLFAEGPDPRSADLSLRTWLGRDWLRWLAEAGLDAHRDAFLGRFPFVDIADDPDPGDAEALEAAHLRSEPASWQVLTAALGRLPDGGDLMRAIGSGEFSTWVDDTFEPSLRQPIKDLATDFAGAHRRTFAQPDTDQEDAWTPSYLEYQFAVAAPDDASGETRSTLVAEEFHGGHLDWHAFDADPATRLEDLPDQDFPANGLREDAVRAFLTAPVEFNGMPNVRWWEFEDRKTDFGRIRAGTTDIPLLLLAEFGLVYGNDWSVLPYRLEVGSLTRVDGIVVTDVFGVRTLVRSADEGAGGDGGAWAMYRLDVRESGGRVDPRLFLPPSLATSHESAPVERVVFARDEMTNTVWGVEQTVPGISGRGIDGHEVATALSRYFLEESPRAEPAAADTEATIRYILGTTVPENWIPFIARRRPDSRRLIRLQRAAMPRLTDAIPGSRVEPRGRILRVGLDGPPPRQPYFLHQEEVPRAGAIVTRSFQRARWFDGKVFTWLGRQKQTGRGSADSGLAFDRIGPTQGT